MVEHFHAQLDFNYCLICFRTPTESEGGLERLNTKCQTSFGLGGGPEYEIKKLLSPVMIILKWLHLQSRADASLSSIFWALLLFWGCSLMLFDCGGCWVLLWCCGKCLRLACIMPLMLTSSDEMLTRMLYMDSICLSTPPPPTEPEEAICS